MTDFEQLSNLLHKFGIDFSTGYNYDSDKIIFWETVDGDKIIFSFDSTTNFFLFEEIIRG